MVAPDIGPGQPEGVTVLLALRQGGTTVVSILLEWSIAGVRCATVGISVSVNFLLSFP